MWQIWLIIAGICLIVEIMTVGFLVFWFAVGSLFVAISSVLLRSKDAGIEEVSMSLDEEFDEDAWEEEWQS